LQINVCGDNRKDGIRLIEDVKWFTWKMEGS
jgi:hypothetical protein